MCLKKKCLLDNLQRVSFEPLHEYTTNADALEGHISYGVSHFQSIDAGMVYKVVVLYGDTKGNEIVADAEQCLDWRLY